VDVFVTVRHPVTKVLNDYLEAVFGKRVYDKKPAPMSVRTAAKEVLQSVPRLTPHGEFVVKDCKLDKGWSELETLSKQHLTEEEAQKLDAARVDLERAIEIYGASENEDTSAAQRLTKLILGATHAVSFLPDVKLEYLVTELISSRDRFLKTAAKAELKTFINDAETLLDDPKAMRMFFDLRRKNDLPAVKLLLAELKAKLD